VRPSKPWVQVILRLIGGRCRRKICAHGEVMNGWFVMCTSEGATREAKSRVHQCKVSLQTSRTTVTVSDDHRHRRSHPSPSFKFYESYNCDIVPAVAPHTTENLEDMDSLRVPTFLRMSFAAMIQHQTGQRRI